MNSSLNSLDDAGSLQTRSVIEALRAQMQDQILRGAMAPGTALTELLVARRFDVARPTAKAAIEQLVHIGLLRRSHHKTARIPQLDATDISDLYLSRGVIESAAVRLLAERGDVPGAVSQALDRLRGAIASRDKVAELVESDVAFHRALVGASQSPRLRRLHEVVIGEAHLCMAQVQMHHLLDPRIIADEHARIVSMIKARDVDAAAAEMDAHLSRARSMLLAHVQKALPTEAAASRPFSGPAG